MSTPGPVRGIKYGNEAVAYGTAAASMTALHGKGSTLKTVRRNAETSDGLTSEPARQDVMPSYVEGEITFGWTFTDTLVANLLKAIGNESSSPYSVGCSGFPTNNSLSVAVNYGGETTDTLEYNYTGLVPVKLRIDFPSNSDAVATVGFAGRAQTVVSSPSDPSPPAASGLLLPSDFGALSIDSTAITYKSAYVEANIGHAFVGLDDIGATVVRRAVWSGQWRLTAGFEFDLDDTTGSDSMAVLNDFVDSATQGELGTILIGSSVVLSEFRMLGDVPSLAPGNIPLSVSGTCETMSFVTT